MRHVTFGQHQQIMPNMVDASDIHHRDGISAHKLSRDVDDLEADKATISPSQAPGSDVSVAASAVKRRLMQSFRAPERPLLDFGLGANVEVDTGALDIMVRLLASLPGHSADKADLRMTT